MVHGRNERSKLLTSRTIPPSIFIVTIFIGSARVYTYMCVSVYMCEGREIKRTNEGYNITVYREH